MQKYVVHLLYKVGTNLHKYLLLGFAILALVAIVVIAVMTLLGPKIGNTFSTINSSLP